jgi:hypothetical protein
VRPSPDRQLPDRLRSNFFRVLTLWILVSVFPSFLCGIAPTILPKVLVDLWSLEHSLSLWVVIASLGLTIFWPLRLMDHHLSNDDRGFLLPALQDLGLLLVVSLPGLTLVTGLAVIPTARVCHSLGYLLALGLGLTLTFLLFRSLLPKAEQSRESLKQGAPIPGLCLSVGYPIFLLFASIFRAREPAPIFYKLSPPLAVLEIIDGATSIGPGLLWLGLLFLVFGLVTFPRYWTRRGAVVAGALVLLFSPQDVYAQEPDLTVLRVESLLGRNARFAESYPIRVHIGRKSPGIWRGQLGVRLGRRSFRVPILIHGGTLNAPQQVDVVLVPSDRQRFVLEAISETGEVTVLPYNGPSLTLLAAEDILVGAWGRESLPWGRDFAKSLDWPKKVGPPRLVSPSLHHSLGLSGEAIDVVLIGSKLSGRSRQLSLLRYVAQGGCLVIYDEARHFAASFPGTFISQGAFKVGRLGSGLVIFNETGSLNEKVLSDLGSLLKSRLSQSRRGRLDLEGLRESFEKIPPLPKTQLGLRFAASSVLVAIILILTLYGFPRERGRGPSHFVFRLFSQHLLGGLLLVSLSLVLILKYALMPPSLTSLECFQVEEMVVGSSWSDQYSFVRLRSAIDRSGQEVKMALSAQLRELKNKEEPRTATLIEQLSKSQCRLTLPLAVGTTPMFLHKDLRSLGQGIYLQRKGESWLVSNKTGLVLKDMLIVSGEKSAWIDTLPVAGQRSLRLEEKAWYQWVEARIRSSAERNFYYQTLPQRESYLERGGVIVCRPVDDGMRRQIGKGAVEVAPLRILMATWLHDEIR